MAAGPDPDPVRLARLLLAEDGPRDVTTDAAVPAGARCAAQLVAEGPLVLAGVRYAHALAAAAGVSIVWAVGEGLAAEAGGVLGTIEGPTRAVLRAERPALNLLQRACGIATMTRRFVDAVRGTGCVVLHTRKTAPGLRRFDAAAVVAGGGAPHRLGLDRIALIKDNHWQAIAAAGTSLADLCRAARDAGAEQVYVEVESAEQVDAACRAGADRLLIDNQPVPAFAALVRRARNLRPETAIEATGGITLGAVRAYAEAGAQYVSVGALTHSPPAARITLEYRAP